MKKIIAWLFASPTFVEVDEVREMRDYYRRLNQAAMAEDERKQNRSWNTDSNWR